MKKITIGYLFGGRAWKDEKIFPRIAKALGIDLVMFNISKDINENKLEELAKKCNLFYNASAEDFAIEIAKTLEALGSRVIDSSETYYFTEDKWMFFVKCKEHGVPVPDTILLSENKNIARMELIKFNRWPVILKRIEGCMGEFVDRAWNADDAIKVIEKFWKKGSERLPIIAQEFIDSDCYRVLVIGDKIVQSVKKSRGNCWKSVGEWAKRHSRLKVDDKLKGIVNKLMKFVDINICGIDLLKKNGEWVVLEVNCEPAFGFFGVDRARLIKDVLIFLKKLATANKH